MADEEKNSNEQEEQAEQPEEAADAPAEEGADAPAEEPKADEAAAEEAAPEEDAAEESGGADAPAEEPAPEDPAADGASADAGDDEDVEEPTPKQRRKIERSRASGPAKPSRSPEERAAERAERRRAAAASRRRSRARSRDKRGEPGQGTPPAERESAGRKVRQGTVTSARAPKTISVQLEITRRHRMYEKVVRRSSTVHAHDERDEAGEGDVVRVVETRPLSRTKRWRLLEIVEKAR
jgi:small subunit ribosomal protein S17